MHWAFDIDTRKLTTPADGRTVRNFQMVYPDQYPVTIDVTRGSDPYPFTGSVVLVLWPLNTHADPVLAAAAFPVINASVANGVMRLSSGDLAAWVPAFGERPAALEVLMYADSTSAVVASLTVIVGVSRRYGPAAEPVTET